MYSHLHCKYLLPIVHYRSIGYVTFETISLNNFIIYTNTCKMLKTGRFLPSHLSQIMVDIQNTFN